MLTHVDSSLAGACPLSEAQSRNLLQFCRRVGADVFTVSFLYAKGEQSEELANNFYQRISPFSAGERLLESMEGNGFRQGECWTLNNESIEAILKETHGNLLACDTLQLPEDWVFYTRTTILLQVVSHEQEATLRLTDGQYAEFQRLSIPHKHGNPQWSGLPEEPIGKTMHEQVLRNFFENRARASELRRDIEDSTETRGIHSLVSIVDMDEEFTVTAEMAVRLCEAVLRGELPPEALKTIGFALQASDKFYWDADEDEVLANVISDWSCPEVNYPLTLENVERFRAWLLRTEPYPPKPEMRESSWKITSVTEKKSVPPWRKRT